MARGRLLAITGLLLHIPALGLGAIGLAVVRGGPIADAFARGASSLWLTYAAAGLALFVLLGLGLLLLRRPQRSRWPLILPVLLPPLAAAFGVRLILARVVETRDVAHAEAEARAFAASAGSALEVLAAGALVTALSFTASATLLSASSVARAQAVRAGSATRLTLGLLIVGTLMMVAITLRRVEALPVLLVATLVVFATSLAATALDGSFARAERAEPAATVDALLAVLMAWGAMALAALGVGAAAFARGLGSLETVAAGSHVYAAQRSWMTGLEALRGAAPCGLPLLAAAALVFWPRRVLVGAGVVRRLPDAAAVAIVVLASIALLRLELTRTARSLAGHWAPTSQEDLELGQVLAKNSQALRLGKLERPVFIGRKHVRQGERELGSVEQLASRAGCAALAAKVEAPASRMLLVAVDATTSFRKMSCFLRAVSARESAAGAEAGIEPCRVRWMATPRAATAVATEAPLDRSKPFPVEVATSLAGAGCNLPASGGARLHLSPSGWTAVRPDRPFPEQHAGAPSALDEWIRSSLAKQAVTLSVEPSVPAAAVLAAAAAIVDELGSVTLVVPGQAPVEARGGSAAAIPAIDPKPERSIEADPPTVKGNIDVDAAVNAVREHHGRIAECYEQGLSRDSTLAGRLVVRFSIQADGKVSTSSSGTPEFPDPVTANCIADVFRQITFPPPQGGGATIFYPLRLEPQRGAPPTSDPPSGDGNQFGVEFSPVKVSGMLAPDEVQRTLETLRQRFAACGPRAGDQPVDGRIRLEFLIDSDGSVSNVLPDPTTTLPEKVASCVFVTAYQTGYPTPTKGTVRVIAPIRITRR